jgi:hypothetical protein
MAKGQKRSNREIRKPKAGKPPAASAPAPVLTMMKGTQATPNKKKG